MNPQERPSYKTVGHSSGLESPVSADTDPSGQVPMPQYGPEAPSVIDNYSDVPRARPAFMTKKKKPDEFTQDRINNEEGERFANAGKSEKQSDMSDGKSDLSDKSEQANKDKDDDGGVPFVLGAPMPGRDNKSSGGPRRTPHGPSMGPLEGDILGPDAPPATRGAPSGYLEPPTMDARRIPDPSNALEAPRPRLTGPEPTAPTQFGTIEGEMARRIEGPMRDRSPMPPLGEESFRGSGLYGGSAPRQMPVGGGYGMTQSPDFAPDPSGDVRFIGQQMGKAAQEGNTPLILELLKRMQRVMGAR